MEMLSVWWIKGIIIYHKLYERGCVVNKLFFWKKLLYESKEVEETDKNDQLKLEDFVSKQNGEADKVK